MRRAICAAFIGAILVAGFTAAPATATPVATSEAEYGLFGRVFPDPLGGCRREAGTLCSPNAKGNVPATQFIGFQELVDGFKFMNTRLPFQRFLEVWTLDGKLGPGAGSGVGPDAFPGNTLGRLEFDPKAEYESAGLPTTTLDRQKSDLLVARVTDESVPDRSKKRYAIALSIHGIERAGAEGGTRAMEDLVTEGAAKAANPLRQVPKVLNVPGIDAPSFDEVLRKTIIYFTYPNPDGWRRGSVKEGGVFFQRYNGNGVDPNRDWLDIGFSYRDYSGVSEPEVRAFSDFYKSVDGRGKGLAAGDDLHGMPFADALSYTMLPHGRHDWAKNNRLLETARTIHEASEHLLTWSPIIQPDHAPPGGDLGCEDTIAAGDACAKIYGQTFGTVYDTINYTTTGTLGDWFDSRAGTNADGIDNEMAFSHIDRNIVFDPHMEQLHVDGNEALIYAHLTNMLRPTTKPFDAAGRKAYVPNDRLTRVATAAPYVSKKAEPQAPITAGPKPQEGQTTIYDAADGFVVEPNVRNERFNGGMRVDVTSANVQGVGTGYVWPTGLGVTLKIECRGCDQHRGELVFHDEEPWKVVAEDYNQRQLYMASGITATVNYPQTSYMDATGKARPVEWRAVVGGPHGATKMRVTFTKEPASLDGGTGGADGSGDDAPALAGYDVANTDVFRDLAPFDSKDIDGYTAIDPEAVIAGTQTLDVTDTLVLADEALPGYTGAYGPVPSGSKTADITFTGGPVTPSNCSRSVVSRNEFTVPPDDSNRRMRVGISWTVPGDLDLFVLRREGDEEVPVGSSTAFVTTSETVTVDEPVPGTYIAEVTNCSSAETTYNGKVTFEAYPPSGGTGRYTAAEKDAWIAALRSWVESGGNLVLTDGALRALPDLTDGAIPSSDVARQRVYVGQVSFLPVDADGDQSTVGHPLSAGVEEPGARFNTGLRRQTYEPTPLGYAIQDIETGADQSNARQFDVTRTTWEKAGGTVAATSADSGARNAVAVTTRVTVGELPLGDGVIRIAGALLPQPTNEWDHPLGIEPHALTYTGYTLLRNLLNRPTS